MRLTAHPLLTLMPNLHSIRSYQLENQTVLPEVHTGDHITEMNSRLLGIGIRADIEDLSPEDRALLEVAEA